MISNTKVKTQAVANGSSTVFPFDFMLLDRNHLVVYLDDELQESGYATSGIGNSSGGLVIFDTAPAPGTIVTFYRKVSIRQLTDYIANDNFPAETHERALDILTMIAQEHENGIGRSIRAGLLDDSTLDELPKAASRAGKVVAFNGDGQLEVIDRISGVFTNGDQIEVSNVSTLQSLDLSKAVNGQLIHLKGYYNAGDGGGGQFIIEATGTANGGTVIALADGRYAKRVSWDGDVRAFGAKGDGVTDDYEAIQAALNTGKNIYFPKTDANTYMVSKQLEVTTDYQQISGDKGTTIRATNDFVGTAVVKIASSVGYNRAFSLSFHGNSIAERGLWCDTIKHLYLNHCWAGFATEAAFYLNTCWTSKIELCRASDSRVGFWAAGATTTQTYDSCYAVSCGTGFAGATETISNTYNSCAADQCYYGFWFQTASGITLNCSHTEGTVSPLYLRSSSVVSNGGRWWNVGYQESNTYSRTGDTDPRDVAITAPVSSSGLAVVSVLTSSLSIYGLRDNYSSAHAEYWIKTLGSDPNTNRARNFFDFGQGIVSSQILERTNDFGDRAFFRSYPKSYRAAVTDSAGFVTPSSGFSEWVQFDTEIVSTALSVSSGTVTASLGTQVEALVVESGQNAPSVGDVLEGATSGATATVAQVILISGAWGSTAVAVIEITDRSGDFEASETLNNTTETNACGTNYSNAETNESSGVSYFFKVPVKGIWRLAFRGEFASIPTTRYADATIYAYQGSSSSADNELITQRIRPQVLTNSDIPQAANALANMDGMLQLRKGALIGMRFRAENNGPFTVSGGADKLQFSLEFVQPV